MAKAIHILSARKAETLTKPGRHADGGNLYLSISKAGARRWVFLYRLDRRQYEMGLGGAGKGGVSLSKARELAGEARSLLAEGKNPLAVKVASKQGTGYVPTFGAFADEYVVTHQTKWRNAKHRAQWAMTIERYCQPIRSLPINQVGTAAVLKVLEPIWSKMPETANRLRGRIEAVLDAAKAKELRSGENPARWRGHLKSLLPARQKLTRGHHAAMAYDDLPAFMADLRACEGLGARALELAILTACRTIEVIGAQWTEIDFDKGLWTVPRERMKAGIEHRVPLSKPALALLKNLTNVRISVFVFPGRRFGKPIALNAMEKTLERMSRDDVTVHGFRSSFRDWASERTNFSHTTAEHALAHQISDKAESAYRRGDELEKRRKLMEAWAQWCESRKQAQVINLAKHVQK